MNCPHCSYPATAGQTVCQNCGRSLIAPPAVTPAGYLMPPGFGAPAPVPSAIGSLSSATAVVFGIVALVNVITAGLRLAGSDASAALASVATLSLIAIIPLFLVWFFKIRQNAGLWAEQRLGQGWSIGAWFTPVIFLWFPYRIAIDAWRTSIPDGTPQRGPVVVSATPQRGPVVVRAWWTCWLLAWFTGFHTVLSSGVGADNQGVTQTSYSLTLGGTSLSNLFSAAAAVLAAVMVMQLGRAQEARRNASFVLS